MVGENFAFKVIIDEAKCDCCGDCTVSCYSDALYLDEEKIVHDIELCMKCECCPDNCPNGAIEVKWK